MKTTGMIILAAALAGGTLAAQAAEQYTKSASHQASSSSATGNTSGNMSSSSGISVSTVNGQTTVTYKGQEVFRGATSGKVSALSSNENGTEYAAAFDGDKVLWENTEGAAGHLKPAGGAPGANPSPKKQGSKHRVDA